MMRIKMIIEFDFDPETGEYTPVSREIVDSTKTLATKSEKKKPSSKPELVSNEASLLLDDNKYLLSEKACELLKVSPDDKIDIKYDTTGIPIIASDNTFGTKGGNRLTQKLTVSFRGKNRERLSECGTNFLLVPTDKEGIFQLIDENKPSIDAQKDDAINPDLVDDSGEDLSQDLLNLLDDPNIKEINNFDFTLK